MESTPSTKREAFEVIYQNLTRLQSSYRQMIMQCSQQLWRSQQIALSADLFDLELQHSLEKNIHIAEDTIMRLERIKYHSSVAILTEGASSTEKDLAQTINEIELLTNVAQIEVGDSEMNSWASEKISYLDNVKNVLLQVLNHKIDTHVRLGKAMYQ
jgi:hypothetical protein